MIIRSLTAILLLALPSAGFCRDGSRDGPSAAQLYRVCQHAQKTPESREMGTCLGYLGAAKSAMTSLCFEYIAYGGTRSDYASDVATVEIGELTLEFLDHMDMFIQSKEFSEGDAFRMIAFIASTRWPCDPINP